MQRRSWVSTRSKPLAPIIFSHECILRIENGLYFANAENVRSRILSVGAGDGVHGVVVDAETTPFVDVSAARMLVAAHDELRARDVPLVLARAVGQVRDVIGCVTDERDLLAPYPTIAEAVEALRGRR